MPAVRTIVYPVADLAAATALFTALLEAPPTMQAPYYVQFDAEGQEIGLDPHGSAKGMTGPVPYWHVVDIRATVDRLVAAGAVEREAVHSPGNGPRLIATLTDPSGTVIGLVQPG